MAVGWETSNRRQELPDNWGELVKAVHARSGGRCEVVRSSGRVCGRPADGGVDHYLDPFDHRLEALKDTCHWHHSKKTAAEGNAAKALLKAMRKRPAEGHPGRMG